MSDLSSNESDSECLSSSQLCSKLLQIHTNEKLSPDLLKGYSEEIDQILQYIKHQKSSLDQSDPTIFSIKSMEITRLEYLIKSYLRTRLRKIETYAQHYCHILHSIANQADGNEENLSQEQLDFYSRFDEEEGKFLEATAANDFDLFKNSIHKHLPENSQLKDQHSKEEYLGTKWPCPNEKAFVFSKVVKPLPENQLAVIDFTTLQTDLIEAKVGQIYLVPFSRFSRTFF